MGKTIKTLLTAVTLATLASCGSTSTPAKDTTKPSTGSQTTTENKTYDGYASGVTFASHGDVAWIDLTIDKDGEVTKLSLNEVFGIRTVGNVINKRTWDKDDNETTPRTDVEKVDGIPANAKVESNKETLKDASDGYQQYISYKYVMIGDKLLICESASGNPVYNEDKADGWKDVNKLLGGNKGTPDQAVIDWWTAAIKDKKGMFLKEAAEGEEVVATTTGGVKLSKLADLTTQYGPSLYKRDNYTTNSRAKTVIESLAKLEKIFLENPVENLEIVSNCVSIKGKDATAGSTLTAGANYLAIYQKAYGNAKAKMNA